MNRLVKAALPLAGLLCASQACAQNLGQNWEGAPRPPTGASPNQRIPERDGLGRYLTPNQGISADEVTWHVRAALNVAALGCRDPADGGMAAAYNHLLASEDATLAAADAGVKAQYRARYGPGWGSVHDRDMTRLYNYFSQVPAHDGFCNAALDVFEQAESLQPGEFTAFAAWAMPLLDAPFTDFYRAYDAYRVADAAWRDGRFGGGVSVAMAVQEAPGGILP